MAHVFDWRIFPGIADQQLPLAGPMGADKQAPNSLLSDEHSELHFKANDTECGLVSYDNCIGDLDKLEQNPVVVVKGRLHENIAFWQSNGASQWLLNVLCEGYCLPFVDFPVNKVFPNHKSASCHAEFFFFVSAEISKLLASGAIVEVLSADLSVCDPLGVLLLDLCYVNQHLRSCKFKDEDVRTATDLFHKGDWFFKLDYSSGYHHLKNFRVITLFWAFCGGLTVNASSTNSTSCLLVCLLALTSSQKSREP